MPRRVRHQPAPLPGRSCSPPRAPAATPSSSKSTNGFGSSTPVQHSTGEEGEKTLLRARARMYTLRDKSFRETGTGYVHLNESTDSTGKHFTRVVLRRDGTLQLVLNSRVWWGNDATAMAGRSSAVRFVAAEKGVTSIVVLRVCSCGGG